MIVGTIKLPRHDIFVQEDFINIHEFKLVIMSSEALDSIIEQCRDIKLKMLEAEKSTK